MVFVVTKFKKLDQHETSLKNFYFSLAHSTNRQIVRKYSNLPCFNFIVVF